MRQPAEGLSLLQTEADGTETVIATMTGMLMALRPRV
jgi:hypothetical protein